MASYTKLAVKGAVTVFVISILAAFLGYLVRFILARNLTVEEFGLFYAVFSFLALLSLLKTLGYDRALIKFIPEFLARRNYESVKSAIITISLIQLITNTVVIVLVYSISNYLAANFFQSILAEAVLRLLAIAFFIDSFVVILKFSFQGFKKMGLFASLDLIRMSILTVAIFVGFDMDWGLLSPVYAYIVAPAMLFLIFGFIFLRFVFPEFSRIGYTFDKGSFKKISKYSFFIMLTSSGALVLGHTDTLMLTYFTGIAAVGLYNVALPTSKILTYFPLAVSSVMLPITSELWAKRKKDMLIEGIENLYKYSMIVILPLALVMVSFTELMMLVLFGKSYVAASTALKILSIGAIFIAIHQINTSFFSGIGKPEMHSKIIYYAVLFNVIGNLILIPLFGINGAAATTAASFLLMMLIGLAKIKKTINIRFPIKIWAKTLIAGLVFVVSIWSLKKVIFANVFFETAFVLAFSGIIYVILLFVFKVLTLTELKDLFQRVFG